MPGVLIIGYGNPSRRDDGVGLAVINRLRDLLGRTSLDDTADGFDELDHGLDTLFLQQLTPELAETIAAYDQVVFVDAHAGGYEELIHRETLQPGIAPSLVSHHMKPGTLLALAAQLYGRTPRAELISIRGFDFDFGSTFTSATAEGIETLVEELWRRFQP